MLRILRKVVNSFVKVADYTEKRVYRQKIYKQLPIGSMNINFIKYLLDDNFSCVKVSGVIQGQITRNVRRTQSGIMSFRKPQILVVSLV